MLPKYAKFDISFSLNQLDGVAMLSSSNVESEFRNGRRKLSVSVSTGSGRPKSTLLEL